MPVDLRNLGKHFGDVSVDSLSIEGWNKIDVVREGLANDGSQDAGQFIEDHADDETLLVFPPGTYSFDTTANIGGVENFGLICPTGRALFTEGDISESEDMIEMGTFETPVESCLISGFTTDTTGARFVEIYGSGVVEDVRFTAEKEFSDSGEATYHISARVFDEEKTLTFKDVLMPEGGVFGEPLNDAAGGWYIHSDTAGTVRFVDCEASGFPNNGIYASPPGEDAGEGGTIHVEGGRFRDNNVSSVRIGGSGSSVRDATFVFENPDDDFTGVRGVYARNGSGHVVENNRFETATDVSDVSHIRVTSECGSVALEDNYHRDDAGVRPLRVSGSTNSDKENRVTVSGLELVGSADTEEYPVFIERDHTKLENILITQPNRSAIWVDADDVVLEDENLSVGNNEVLNQGDRFVRNGVSENEGDPNSAGAWSGQDSLAAERGVLIQNVSETPSELYAADRQSGNGYVNAVTESASPTWTGQHQFSGGVELDDTSLDMTNRASMRSYNVSVPSDGYSRIEFDPSHKFMGQIIVTIDERDNRRSTTIFNTMFRNDSGEFRSASIANKSHSQASFEFSADLYNNEEDGTRLELHQTSDNTANATVTFIGDFTEPSRVVEDVAQLGSSWDLVEPLSEADDGLNNHFKLNNVLNLSGNNINNVRSDGDSPVVSGTDYEIQKDGTDGNGIINFKT